LGEPKYRAYVDRALELEVSASKKEEGDIIQIINQPTARLAYCKSQLYFALGEHDKAREEVECALAATTNSDVKFLDDCKARLAAYSRSKLQRDQIDKRNRKNIENVKDDLKNSISERFEAYSKEKQAEIVQEVSLRVVEVLGIFIAIIGIVATTAGGIFGNDSTSQGFQIFGVGFGSTIIMFMLLRVIVHTKPRPRQLRFWKKDGKTDKDDKAEMSGSGA